MPKISALPPMTTADAADEAPIVDTSVTTTKKWTLTLLKTYLQSLVGWITTAMLADASVTAVKRSQVVKVGTFNYIGANGAIAVTGVGFQPKAIIFFGSMDSSHQSAGVANFQIGFSDGTTARGFGFRGVDAGDVSGVVSTSNVGWIPGINAGVASSFVLTTIGTDGFTVTVSANAGSVTPVAYIAIA